MREAKIWRPRACRGNTNMMLLHDVKEPDGVQLMPEQEQKLKAGPATPAKPEFDDPAVRSVSFWGIAITN